jgi:alkylhydroperoxidase family enzyme
MRRVKPIYYASDYTAPDAAMQKDIQELFDHLCPGDPKPPVHEGYAALAQSPRLALNIAKLADYIVRDMPWSQQRDLRELSVQALNLHFKCDFSFQSHLEYGVANGLSLEEQAAIPYWRTTNIFNDEQRLVLEYTFAVCEGAVPEDLFARVVKKYGEKGAMEFTTVVAWWSFWAMLLNAFRPEYAFERAQPLPGDEMELAGHRSRQ